MLSLFPLLVSPVSPGALPGMSLVGFSGKFATVQTLGQISPGLTLEPTNEPTPAETSSDPSPSPTSTSEPTPEPTVTVTQTVAAEPQSVILDGEQYGGITTGLVLVLVLLAACLVAQMRRP